MLARDLQRGPGVLRVIRIDPIDGAEDVVHLIKTKQSFTGGQHITKARFLGDDWPSRGEIGRGAVAEPSAAQAYVLIFGDGEFSARLADVIAVWLLFSRKFARLPDAP